MQADPKSFVRVVFLGGTKAGKSTLVAVLSKGIPDDGKGLSRRSVLLTKQEVETGVSSNNIEEILGFDLSGQPVFPDQCYYEDGRKDWRPVMENSTKFLLLMDTCGDIKHLSKMLFAVCAQKPEYAVLTIAADEKANRMLKLSMLSCLIFKIPIIFVITKTDLVSKEVLGQAEKEIKSLLKNFDSKKLLLETNESNFEANALHLENSYSQDICLLFKVSCVTQESISQLRLFLYRLKPQKTPDISNSGENFLMSIINVFDTKRSGKILYGLVYRSCLNVGQKVRLGPLKDSCFLEGRAKELEFFRQKQSFIFAGQTATVSLDELPESALLSLNNEKAGLFLTLDSFKLRTAREFHAQIHILGLSSCTITKGYKAIIHIGAIEKSVEMIEILEKKFGNFHGALEAQTVLRHGDFAEVRFRFEFKEECIWKDQVFILREGEIRAAGVITKVSYQEEAQGKKEEDFQKKKVNKLGEK